MLFRIFCIVFCVIVFSCNDKSNKHVGNVPTTSISSPEELLAEAPRSLDLPHYLTLLQKMNKVTYDESESPEHRLSILYKPQVVEAALSLDGSYDSSSYQENLKLKEGYHYVLINYLDKIPSVTGTRETKEETIKKIKERLLVIKNTTDTLTHTITEVVPSSVMGQPDQVLVLIPYASTDRHLRVVVQTDFSDINNVSIDLETALLNKLPQLKL